MRIVQCSRLMPNSCTLTVATAEAATLERRPVARRRVQGVRQRGEGAHLLGNLWG